MTTSATAPASTSDIATVKAPGAGLVNPGNRKHRAGNAPEMPARTVNEGQRPIRGTHHSAKSTLSLPLSVSQST